jgi:hypothetical protein
MEDEKQLVRDLFKKPYSKQALDDALDAFKDLSGKDRRALTAEFLSSQLGKDFENFSRQFAQALEKLGPQLEALGKVDSKEMLVRLIQRLPYERGRNNKQVEDDARRKALDTAIIAEAARLNKILAISLEFADLVRPGVLKRLKLPGKAKWPSKTTIKRAISRIRGPD